MCVCVCGGGGGGGGGLSGQVEGVWRSGRGQLLIYKNWPCFENFPGVFIQLRGLNTLRRFSATSHKSCDFFFFAFPHVNPLLKRDF